ncbi:hypothetical protein Tco_0124512, partial [Tanacetum coccineum]
IPRIDETALANRFVYLNSEISSSKAFTLSSNLNKEPKVGRFYREELGAIVGVGTGVCYRGLNERNVFKLRMESMPVSGLGLSMLEMKPDDTEELCY